MATKKSTRVNKSAFVRLHPNTPPREVVTMAKASGISFDEKYVHNVRWKDKTVARDKGFVRNSRKTNTPPVVATRRKRRTKVEMQSQSFDEQFVSLVMDLGLVKATALLGQIRQAAQTLTPSRLIQRLDLLYRACS